MNFWMARENAQSLRVILEKAKMTHEEHRLKDVLNHE